MIVTSFAPTYGDTSPDAIVDTISFGSPIGKSRTARAAIEDPPLPPTASTASTRPAASSSAATTAAPSPISVTAAPRSPASRSISSDAPAASATRSAGMSASL